MCLVSAEEKKWEGNLAVCYFVRNHNVNVDLVSSENTWFKRMRKLFVPPDRDCILLVSHHWDWIMETKMYSRARARARVDAKFRCVHFLHFALIPSRARTFAYSSIVIFTDPLVAFSLRGRDKSPKENLVLHVCFGFYFDSIFCTKQTRAHTDTMNARGVERVMLVEISRCRQEIKRLQRNMHTACPWNFWNFLCHSYLSNSVCFCSPFNSCWRE